MKSTNLSVYPASFGSDPLFPKKSDFEIHKTSKSKGLGVITKRAFAKGEFVAKMAGPTVDTIQQHTLQIAKDVHLHDTYFSGYFLHSCDPNIHVDMQKLEVIALKPIKKNAYLYMDYSDTEDSMHQAVGLVPRLGRYSVRWYKMDSWQLQQLRFRSMR